LRHNGIDFLAIVGDAAVCGIVAIPTDGGVAYVEVRKIDGRYPSGRAVNQQPSSALPLPVRRRGFLRQTVVQAEGAANHEQALGDVVSRTKSKFLDAGVEQKRAHFQRERLVLR